MHGVCASVYFRLSVDGTSIIILIRSVRVGMRVCLDAGRGKSICLAGRGRGGHVEASGLSRSGGIKERSLN